MAKKTKNTSTFVGEPKPQFLKGALVAALGIVIIIGAPVKAQAPPGATEIRPTDTLATIQAAVDGGGVVYFHPGAYSWTGILNVNNSVELTGPKPTGDFNTSTGADNRVWEAKITKSPVGVWDPNDQWDWDPGNLAGAPLDPTIQIDCPGDTENVIISNLDIECLAMGMCIALVGGGDSMKVSNCRMKTVDDGYGFCSWLGSSRSVTIEDCYIEAGTAGFLYPGDIPPNTDCIVFGMSIFETIEVKNNIAINHCDTLNVSTAVEIVWRQNPTTQVTISDNYLKSSGEGYAIFYYDSACSIGTVRHNTVIGNYHFLHLENDGSGGTVESNRFECSGGGLASLYFKDSSDVTVKANTFTGSVSLGGIGLAGNSSHNVFIGNDMSHVTAGVMQILVEPGCQDNLFTRNVFGSLGPGAMAGVQCSGDSNSFIKNDYTRSGIPGLTAGAIPCVWLANSYDPDTGNLIAEPENNLVFEPDGFPLGTTAAEQVLDDPRECTGTTTNIVVGH